MSKKSKRGKTPRSVILNHNGTCYVVTDRKGTPWRCSDYRSAERLVRLESGGNLDAVTVTIAATDAITTQMICPLRGS